MPDYQYTNWAIATTVSVLLHVSAAYYWQQIDGYTQPAMSQKQTPVIAFELQPASAPVENTIREDVIAAPTVPEVQPPPAKPEPKPEPEPEKPKPRPQTENRPEQKKPAIQAEVKKPAPQPAPEKPQQLAQNSQPKILVESKNLQAIREHYIARLLKHIDAHKYYPRKARRRGYEGIVDLHMVIAANGQLSTLSADHDNRILRDTAIKVVRRSQPLPQPPADVDLPLTIDFGMEFRLTQ